MSKQQSKEVIANQKLLKETTLYGGPEGLREHYINEGVLQERNRWFQVGKLIWRTVAPYVVTYAGSKIAAWSERRKQAKESKETNEIFFAAILYPCWGINLPFLKTLLNLQKCTSKVVFEVLISF